jgi:PPOX class probable F420-dependent enzyme
MPEIAPQRRARRIAMSAEERDAFLREQRTCRVASVGADGSPHVTPLWYVWDGEHLWLNSLTRSQRHANLLRDPRIAVVVDSGDGYSQLRGVEFSGRAALVAAPEAVETLFAERYFGGAPYVADGKHAWLSITPEREYTWDFRKL